jgi:CheY-like chemotaxis protein/two-component sensor histidine kinase
MSQALDQMVRLVDDLLDMSRITTGKLQVRKERVELAAVMRTAVEATRPLVDEQRHELNVTLPATPILLDADPTRLAQVFSNLLNNAAKYSESDGRIAFAAERLGNEVIVRVTDAGIGIAAEDLPRIFEMFTQVDMEIERSRGGLGIGLALVKGLVEMHGGTIEARSGGSGKGSAFIVRLPIVVADAPPESPAAHDRNENASRTAYRILVVDDNQLSRESTAAALKLMGHEVTTARDGMEGVARVQSFEPDVILLDIGLPGLNGYEIARRIRVLPSGQRPFLIAVTGYGQEEDRRRALEAGFNSHMVKPVNFGELKLRLVELRAGAAVPSRQT